MEPIFNIYGKSKCFGTLDLKTDICINDPLLHQVKGKVANAKRLIRYREHKLLSTQLFDPKACEGAFDPFESL